MATQMYSRRVTCAPSKSTVLGRYVTSILNLSEHACRFVESDSRFSEKQGK